MLKPNRTLAIGRTSAEPGSRATDRISIDLGGPVVDVPVVLLNGARPGPRLGVTAGIHGAEYVSIAALREVAMSLDPAVLSGSLVAVLTANPAAFTARSIYVNPIDGRNLNRVFPGDPAGTPSEQLAAWIFDNVIRPADAFVDMHCGDMNEALASFTGIEETGDPAVDARSLAMAEAYGLGTVLVGPTPGSTTTAAAASGIPAVLGEVGGQGRWPAEDVALHAAGLRRVLRSLGMVDTAPDEPRRPTLRLDHEAWLRSEADGCWEPAVAVGDRVSVGQEVGMVRDVFGAPLQVVRAPLEGVVLFLVTSLAMNVGDPLLAIAG
ncbi:MAG: succinylglutamate desuccinylase/aspartoacylase family protein [Chloroflexi bacterium]|nr:succinylglutamate desuccinylase/aspartoacylase family protein [Chloroflexota bacterium]